ncbi:hypothetical protein QM012_001776 [Aureobasidium pullulans]|uniref:Pentacotripeptide-repeat region of PRORP domain-containing protein n=1 Tax=Aureobasidium pullulans TaxID=5580 RepID=A0ABR0TCH1_AURPU
MLERTSACLDTGVRFSLRQKSLFPKSRRLLHSSFWSTNAPDVDHLCLYPNAASSAPASASPDSHDLPPLFLDFLYPAPTQAFMARLSQCERWSRRNTRPNVLRGYSSLTAPKDSSSSSASPTRAHQELLVLLDSPSPDQSFLSLDIERIWNFLSQIPDPSPDLLCRAIHWFSNIDDRTAAQHAVDLFADIPDGLKSPTVYGNVIRSNLRLDRQSVAAALHKEASVLPAAGSIASGHLMAVAVHESDWPLAVNILKEWESYTGAVCRGGTAPLFDETTKILRQFLDQVHHLRRLCSQRMQDGVEDESTQDLQRLYRLLVHRYIWAQSREHVFLRSDFASNLVRGYVRALIQETHKHGLATADLYEKILLTLLNVEGCALNHNCSALVTATYLLYRQSEFFAPSKVLLLEITKHWRDHNLAFAGEGPRDNFIGKERILNDWNKYHQKPSDEALATIMDAFAQRGFVKGVKQHADLYASLHAKGDLDAEWLKHLLTVHAVNNKPSLAAQQLRNMQREYGVPPNLRCWNIVLDAFVRADDLPQAMKILLEMMNAGIQPDEHSYTSLLNAYAKQGDIDGVIDLLDFAKSEGVTRPSTLMLNCMILALVRNSEMDGALKALDQTVQAVHEGRADGSLTPCFNTVLTAFAWKRDFKATIATYRRMQQEKVPLDERSYGALMLVLCLFRQSPSAHRILKSVMPAQGIRPLAFHYAILTRGYMGQELYSEAVKVQAEMEKARIRETAGSRATAMKAKALYEHQATREQTNEDGHLPPLEDVIEDFQKVLNDTRTFRHGTQPQPSEQSTTDISYLIFIHGRRRSFEAVQHLFQMFQTKLAEIDTDHSQAPIVLLLTNLMFVHTQAQEWREVDKYWDLIKSRVDEIRLSYIPATKLVQSVKYGKTTRTPRDIETARVPAPYRLMLSIPLQYYIRSQFAQSSIRKLIPMIMKLLAQGFQFANKTWNELIVQLCQTSPPRALLAYTLVEKYMMKDWPGWISHRHGSIRKPETVYLKMQTRKEGFEYINARYINKNQLIPQYRTMVHLANALLEVRGLASRGLGEDHDASVLGMRELRKQVGTIPEIREQAPKTLHAIQSMPRVVDELQGRLLRAQ